MLKNYRIAYCPPSPLGVRRRKVRIADLEQLVASAGDDEGKPDGFSDLDLLHKINILLDDWLDLLAQLIGNLCSSSRHSGWHLAPEPARSRADQR